MFVITIFETKQATKM